MYHFIKLKHPVLPGLPTLNTYAKQLHVASKMFLRRKLSNITPAHQEFEHFKENSSPPSACEDTSIDFLGIESDDGVIVVKPCKTPISESNQTPRKKEKFYSTSYGVVRYDSDNKLKHHGQFRDDFYFPHKSHDYAIVLKNLQNLSMNSSTSSSNITDCEDGNENIKLQFNEKKSKKPNYVDQVYFGSITESENTNQNNSNITQDMLDEFNFLDKKYFSTLTDSEISNSPENSISDMNNEIFIQREHSSDEPKIENQPVLQQLDYFDKMYFENSLSSKNVVNSDWQNFSKERFPSERLTYDYPVAENFEMEADENFSYNENKTDIKSYGDLKGDHFLSTEKKSDHLKESSVDNLFNVSSDIEYQDKRSKKLNSNIEYLNESGVQSSAEIEISSTKRLRDKLVPERIKQKNRGSVSDVKVIEPSAKKNNFKYSLTKSKEDFISESTVEENITTAHDFITKLRKEQKICEPTIKKEKDMTKIKFDSKGFRILKNQVADLSHFTRDEILNLLIKNVVYSDSELIVLNKPYGLVIHDSQTTKQPCLSTFLDSLAKEMDRDTNNPKLFTVHRIDKETTGCLLLARTETMAQHLKSLFAQRKIIKKYWIITTRVPDPPAGIIDIPISEGSINKKKRMVLHPKLPKDLEYKNHSRKGKEAITSYKVLSESGNAALVEVMPKTGIKHQIRVHFGFGLSCPILGDHKYSHMDKLAPQVLQNDMLERLHVRQSKVRYIPMHIHARTVIVPNYFEDSDLLVNIPLPEHMKMNLKMLKFKKRNMS